MVSYLGGGFLKFNGHENDTSFIRAAQKVRPIIRKVTPLVLVGRGLATDIERATGEG
jgi:hypothetical protein